jgi:hypothetical protein
MTKTPPDPVAGGVAAFRRLTGDDTSAGEVTRARLFAGMEHRRHRSRLSKRTAFLVLLPLVASSALAATLIRATVWTRPSVTAPPPLPAMHPRSPSRRAAQPITAEQAAPGHPPEPGVAPTAGPAPTHRQAGGPDAELIAYGIAHRAHFASDAPVRTLRLWNAYLRDFPHGRFLPEATYNRAITLLRLNRRREAAVALRPLAAGRFGGYRQVESRALLDALPPE